MTVRAVLVTYPHAYRCQLCHDTGMRRAYSWEVQGCGAPAPEFLVTCECVKVPMRLDVTSA